MLKNNIKIAWRSLKKDRQFTLLNLVGLSTGLACALFIYLWVTDELNVDKFNKQDSQLFQIMEHRKKADGIWTSHSSSYPLAEALVREMPEVQYATPVKTTEGSISLPADKSKELRVWGRFVGKDYFMM